MNDNSKQLSNAYSAGGGGAHFETRVQASFVVLMLTGGFSPCLPNWPIEEIKLQGKYKGYDTDDLIIYAKQPGSDKRTKLLGQIKHSVKITKRDIVFGEVIQATWTDFNNKELFNDSTDVLALITGPLSATDTINVRALLNQAHYSKDSTDFIQRVSLGRFTSDGQRNKLDVFKTHLKNANNNVEVTDDVLWRFLKCFKLLLYDLDIKGVVLSLIHTLIGQFSQKRAQELLALIEQEVAIRNENAGSLEIDSIPEEIRSAFLEREKRTIPTELFNVPLDTNKVNWCSHKYPQDLVEVSLMGAWNEKSLGDIDIISRFAQNDYSDLVSHFREILLQSDSPVAIKNGVWRVINRKELLNALDQRIFDETLNDFKSCAITVLSERDPKFSLQSEDRFASRIQGNVPKFSASLREGIAEGLALLGNYGDFANSSFKPKEVAAHVIFEVFKDSDWELWGSLDNLLPLIAEASPEQFLIAVEDALLKQPSPLEELLKQEGDGFTGETYLSGLLWALETLAWDELFLVRVTVILGELASLDHGGMWANRPANSLTTIYLPWYPQTVATIEKRKVAVKILLDEHPMVGWKLLINLIPNQSQTSSGSHKPKWRKIIPEDEVKTNIGKEYWEQVGIYCELAVDLAEDNIDRLSELVRYLDNLPTSSFDRVLYILSSENITGKPEVERIKLWSELVKISLEHRRYKDAKWTLNSEMISKIEEVANILIPKNPLNLHQILFDGRTDFYIEPDNWQGQSEKIEQNRKKALSEIFDFGGIDAILDFSKLVGNPTSVGFTLGAMLDITVDDKILPSLVNSEEQNKKVIQFIKAFVKGRVRAGGINWVDSISKDDWTQQQIGQFYAWLPFYKGIWDRAISLLGDEEKEYWDRVEAFPSSVDNSLEEAINKLLIFGRPNAAVDCLYSLFYHKKPLDKNIVTDALLKVVKANVSPSSMELHHYIELIKALQNDPNSNPNALFEVEWAYLPLLNKYNGARPEFLENRLASDPAFFNSVIGIVYRSRKEGDSAVKPTEDQQATASNAFKLLSDWKIPPGTEKDGSFSKDGFNKWLSLSKKMCEETGHLEVALTHIGKVLYYSPMDKNGLWINKEVAKALNSVDAWDMRKGFSTEVYNSRGVYWVDPSGKPEKELAEKYREMADQIENAGYFRFAATLKGIADSYDHEAERVIKKHQEENKNNV
jgi:hypothetical protein